MNISIIGAGYVGLVTGTCLAEVGHHVTCVDINTSKIENLKQGIMPIYEQGLEELVKVNYKAGRLHFVDSIQQAPRETLIYFIAVGTPSQADGSANMTYVFEAAKAIADQLADYAIIITKSTVPIGTADKVKAIIEKRLQERGVDIRFDLVSNPEFLKEGDAVNDFMRPDRVIIGSESEEAKTIMNQLYLPFTRHNNAIFHMSLTDAEMTKYVSNAMLATKISFMNEMASICERVGADVENVRLGIGSDSRIGYSFIYPGCGYGGSCFPKDIKALIHVAKEANFEPLVLNAVEARNHQQKQVLHKKLIRLFGEDLSHIKIAVWGLAFKPGTDDMREASSAVFLEEVIKRGAVVKAYDPVAMPVAQLELPQAWYTEGKLSLVQEQYEALKDADVLVLITEWKPFRYPHWQKMKGLMRGNVILDGRNQYDLKNLVKDGFRYVGIGRGENS